MAPISYRRHRFPPVVIQHAVWLYLRFTLSYRDVEELLAERGLDISYESVRSWVLKFGPAIARGLRACRPRPSDRWHLDEMVIRIAGKQMYLWRAVDHGVAVRRGLDHAEGLCAGLAADDEPGAPELLQVLRGIVDRQARGQGEPLHASFALDQDVEQLEAVGAAQGAGDQRKLLERQLLRTVCLDDDVPLRFAAESPRPKYHCILVYDADRHGVRVSHHLSGQLATIRWVIKRGM